MEATNQGYSSEQVTFAIEICGADKQKVNELLTTYKQLLQLGFQEGDIKEAMLLTDRKMMSCIDYISAKSKPM